MMKYESKRENGERYGCDCCKSLEVPTEKFEGYVGGVLWICSLCYQQLIREGKNKK